MSIAELLSGNDPEKLSTFPPTFDDLFFKMARSMSTWEGESERGCLLVGLSFIDDRLGVALSAALKKHGANKDADWLLDAEAGNRPLGTLAVRTRMARCLGLIDDEMRNTIDQLRKLRNKHAHGIGSFELSETDMLPVIQTLPLHEQSLMHETIKKPATDMWKDFSLAKKQLLHIMLCVGAQIDCGRKPPPETPAD